MKNDPNRLPPIPTPPSAVWREFRIRVVPLVVFIVIVCAAALIWKSVPLSGAVRGVGEGLRSVVTCPRIGVIQRLEVQPFQWVDAGDRLLTILPQDPNAQLDLLQLQSGLTRLQLEPSITDRNALNYEQVRVDAYTIKAEVKMAEAQLQTLSNAVKRYELLLKDQLVSRDIYEQSLRDYELTQAEFQEKTASLKAIEGRLEQLRALGEPGTNLLTNPLITRLQEQLVTLETNWGPITLRAPISGRVHLIHRQQSEFVVEGEPLVLIASPRSERIIAYVRQPFSFEPQPGMEVEVLMQNKQRQRFTTRIEQVGAQLEPITNALAFLQQGALVDMGLPVLLKVPPDISLRPGETVSINPRSQPINLFGRKLADAADKSEPSVQVRR